MKSCECPVLSIYRCEYPRYQLLERLARRAQIVATSCITGLIDYAYPLHVWVDVKISSVVALAAGICGIAGIVGIDGDAWVACLAVFKGLVTRTWLNMCFIRVLLRQRSALLLSLTMHLGNVAYLYVVFRGLLYDAWVLLLTFRLKVLLVAIRLLCFAFLHIYQ